MLLLSFSWSLSLLFLTPAVAIPPGDFGFPETPNHTALSVTFQNNGNPVTVHEADLFGVGSTEPMVPFVWPELTARATVPAQEPIVAVETSQFESIATYNGSYVVLMVDPDARYPQNPSLRFIIHWLQTDMTPMAVAADGTSRLVNSSAPRVPYLGPAPPTNSSAHRYIVYAFFQHDNFTFPPDFEGFNATNRISFNLTTFLDDSHLGQVPAAAMYFFASNETGVPPEFSAAAGGTYPGGNGDMITAGPGPSFTPASTATAATASGTGSATGSAASTTPTGGVGKNEIGTGIMMAGLILFLQTHLL